MADARNLIRLSGFALAIAGLVCVPIPFIPAWSSTQDVGTATWEIAYHLGGAHHLILLPGLAGLLAVHGGRAGPLLVTGFVLTMLGNALAAGMDIVHLTILPVLAASPETQGLLVCTPFHTPATRAAEGFIATACGSASFDVLANWLGAARITLLSGSIALGIAVARARVLPAWPGIALVAGAAYAGIAAVAPLPLAVANLGLAAIGAAYVAWGAALVTRNRPGSGGSQESESKNFS